MRRRPATEVSFGHRPSNMRRLISSCIRTRPGAGSLRTSWARPLGRPSRRSAGKAGASSIEGS
eukprot:9387259-Alexandrium_andersonii.AAC.1